MADCCRSSLHGMNFQKNAYNHSALRSGVDATNVIVGRSGGAWIATAWTRLVIKTGVILGAKWST